MFNARCCQKAKKTYENANTNKAINMTTLAKFFICVKMFELEPLLKATATFPITIEIDGRIAPARMAEAVPAYSSTLSVVRRYVKYFLNLICLTGGATSFVSGAVYR